MLSYRLLTGVGVLCTLIFIFTQIILPALRGTQLFPAFRAEGRIRKWAAARRQMKRERDMLEKEINDE